MMQRFEEAKAYYHKVSGHLQEITYMIGESQKLEVDKNLMETLPTLD
jgi:hypothetical protein